MRIFVFFLMLFISQLAVGQVFFDKNKYDFGDLEMYDNRFVDFILTNKNNKTEYLLRITKSLGIAYIVSGESLEKDSSIAIRLQINAKKKGYFSYEIEIYTSDKVVPTKIKLTGNIKEVPQDNLSALTACPSFSALPSGKKFNEFELTIITIDKESKVPLSKSLVVMLQNGRQILALTTDKSGKIKQQSTFGFSYFYASHDGYFPTEIGEYINFQRNYIILELERDSRVDLAPSNAITTDSAFVEEVEKIVVNKIDLEVELENDKKTENQIEIPIALSQLDKNNFSETYFKPVNVVFVLDISSSMKQNEKLELMKYALIQLVNMLRAEDKITIVTYSTEAKVLISRTSGVNKEKINAAVGALKAAGLTAGGKGIKLGYKQARKAFIENGINQVIVITDGAFNRYSQEYEKTVKKYQKKGIHLSVVGIQNKKADEQKMLAAAELGGGRYIPIFKLADAQSNLKEEIRLISFKK
jgi:Ca-activated chloride channel family protein